MPLAKPARIAAGIAAVAVAYTAGVLTTVLTGGHGSGSTPIDQAEATIEKQSATAVPQSVLEEAAVDGMLKALGDDFSAYYSPSDYEKFQQVLSGTYTGVGLWVRKVDTTLEVADVVPGSPAARAGLRDGDQVVSVAGRPVARRTVADVVSTLRGDAGTKVSVTVRRGTRDVTVALVRQRVDEDSVSATMLSPLVVSLRITSFTDGVGAWVHAQVAAARAHHLQGVVLDLRDDPGGLLEEAVATASAFLPSGPVTTYTQRGHAPQVLNATGGGDGTIPLVVLVDGGTASAAEIVAGALHDRDRAVLVGSRTFGKGSVQQPQQLSDGSAVELTVGHYLTPSGTSVDGVGITPDVAVAPGSSDSVYESRALEVLSGVTADAGSTGRG